MQAKIKHEYKRRRYAAPLGGAVIFLALIGIITVVYFSINLTVQLLDNSSEKAKLEGIVHPVMMFDPVPFENAANIDSQSMLLYCMWANLGTNTYAYNDYAERIVPASDLDVVAARLFGQDITLQHQTFKDYGNPPTTYYYDEVDGIYTIPESSQLYVYSPQVEDIQRDRGDFYNVLVGYLPPSGDAWTTDFLGNKGSPEPDKYMIYYMEKDGNDYRIAAIRDVESDTPMADPSQAAGGQSLPAESPYRAVPNKADPNEETIDEFVPDSTPDEPATN